jgi:4'-phosphopantetheinyl transferase
MSTSPDTCPWADASTADFDSPGQIHVWKISLFVPLSADLDILAASELQRSQDFKNEIARNTYLCSRIVMRRLIASYLNRPAYELEFNTTARGKPFLCGNGPGLKFNLSHSGELMLLAISPSLELGVDIEQQKSISNWEKIASKVFNKTIIDSLKQSIYPQKAFIREWTAFEAKHKLFGEGIFGHLPKSADMAEIIRLDIKGFEASLCYNPVVGKPQIKCFRYYLPC